VGQLTTRRQVVGGVARAVQQGGQLGPELGQALHLTGADPGRKAIG